MRGLLLSVAEQLNSPPSPGHLGAVPEAVTRRSSKLRPVLWGALLLEKKSII